MTYPKPLELPVILQGLFDSNYHQILSLKLEILEISKSKDKKGKRIKTIKFKIPSQEKGYKLLSYLKENNFIVEDEEYLKEVNKHFSVPSLQ